MVNLEEERKILMDDIYKLGYESLRYSIFNDHEPAEWETRIEFNSLSNEYEVYSTMDRASTNGKDIFKNFQDARSQFITSLQDVVLINQYYIETGMNVEYSSPLWDKENKKDNTE